MSQPLSFCLAMEPLKTLNVLFGAQRIFAFNWFLKIVIIFIFSERMERPLSSRMQTTKRAWPRVESIFAQLWRYFTHQRSNNSKNIFFLFTQSYSGDFFLRVRSFRKSDALSWFWTEFKNQIEFPFCWI